MIVSGEASGDGHAAKLVRAIREFAPESEFFGAAGPKMREAGVEAVVVSDELSVVGLAEIGMALPVFLRAMRDLRSAAKQRLPDVAILVDFPEFNLKLAKSLKKQGVKVVYYISPQLWAWRKYRVSAVKKYTDLMITILPFEKAWYADHGVDHVEYVGNPLASEVYPSVEKTEFCRANGLDPMFPIIALLPGSRQTEIVKILPNMLDAAARIASHRPEIQFLIVAAQGNARKDIDDIIRSSSSEILKLEKRLKIVENQTYDAVSSADAAAVASGTATLETGLLGTPMTIVYKTSSLNYFLGRPLIDVEHYGLINLIAQERIASELIQADFTPETLADELFRLLEPSVNQAMRKKLSETAAKLGQGGASMRAAEAILKLIDSTG